MEISPKGTKVSQENQMQNNVLINSMWPAYKSRPLKKENIQHVAHLSILAMHYQSLF